MSEDPQPKLAKDMTADERAAVLAKLKRPKPEPMPTDVMARDMTPDQRAKFIREINRRFG
jgi:hypothetical protein